MVEESEEMTDSSLDIAVLNELLKSEWLDDESKKILKDTITRVIKIMPNMVKQLEEAFPAE